MDTQLLQQQGYKMGDSDPLKRSLQITDDQWYGGDLTHLESDEDWNSCRGVGSVHASRSLPLRSKRAKLGKVEDTWEIVTADSAAGSVDSSNVTAPSAVAIASGLNSGDLSIRNKVAIGAEKGMWTSRSRLRIRAENFPLWSPFLYGCSISCP